MSWWCTTRGCHLEQSFQCFLNTVPEHQKHLGGLWEANCRHDVSESLGVGMEKWQFSWILRTTVLRILNLGSKIPDLSINNQQWTFKYFLENSRTLIKDKKMRKRLPSITHPASRQSINHIESSCNLHSSITSIYFIRSKEIKALGEKSYLEHNDKSQSGC